MHQQIRLSNAVERCHTQPFIVRETIGHHSANVAGILIAIYHPIIPPQQLLYAALVHDWPEYDLGDVPAPVKWNNPVIAEQHKNLEIEWFDKHKLENPDFMLNNDELELLHFADKLDLYAKCVEENRVAGTTERLRMLRRLSEYLCDNVRRIDSQFKGRCGEMLEAVGVNDNASE